MTKWSLGGDYIITKCWINGNWILTKRSLNIDEMITIWWLKSHFILSYCLQMLTENQLNVNEMVTYCWTIHVYIHVQYIRNLMRRLSIIIQHTDRYLSDRVGSAIKTINWKKSLSYIFGVEKLDSTVGIVECCMWAPSVYEWKTGWYWYSPRFWRLVYNNISTGIEHWMMSKALFSGQEN